MVAFDQYPDRPEHISNILNGLDRYNPETVTTFQEYVSQQCENQTYDSYANLALLKLYQFNPHLSREDSVTAILVKALTVFPSPDFSLCLHLLPPSVLATQPSPKDNSAAAAKPVDASSLAEAVQKLDVLNAQLSAAEYAQFWATLRSDDLYADLVSEVSGFEELMRVRIAAVVGAAVREVRRPVLEEWLDLKGAALEKFVGDVCGWKIDGQVVAVPLNKENEARGTVVRENVKFDQFSRVVRRAFEQPV